jgi:formate dehydrogenase maturation protein FdhE
MATAL